MADLVAFIPFRVNARRGRYPSSSGYSKRFLWLIWFSLALWGNLHLLLVFLPTGLFWPDQRRTSFVLSQLLIFSCLQYTRCQRLFTVLFCQTPTPAGGPM